MSTGKEQLDVEDDFVATDADEAAEAPVEVAKTNLSKRRTIDNLLEERRLQNSWPNTISISSQAITQKPPPWRLFLPVAPCFLNQAVTLSELDQVHQGPGIELEQQASLVRAHRLVAEEHPISDLLVGLSLGQLLQHHHLPA